MASTIMALPAAYAEQLAKCSLAVDEQTLEGCNGSLTTTEGVTQESPQKPPTPPPKPTLGARLYWARRLARAALRSIKPWTSTASSGSPCLPRSCPTIEVGRVSPRLHDYSQEVVDGASPLELRDAYLPEDLSVDLKLIWRNCAHFNGEDSWLASYSRKVGKQAQDILDRFSRTHAHLHNLREELQKDDWDLDEETRNFHKVRDSF